MTTQTATAPSTPIRSRHRGLLTAPAVAGIGFAVAWVTGLAVWPSNLDVAASGAKVVSAYTGHQGVAVTQYLLVEGLAAIALAVVVIALARAARQRGAVRLASVAQLAGIGAVTVSLVECALGLVLAGAAVSDGETGRAGTLFHLINRLDGAKMLALAALALASVAMARSGGLLPRWLGNVAAALAAAMVASGAGYLLLSNTLSQAAAASLGLLLIWVVGTGVALGRRSERETERNRDAARPVSNRLFLKISGRRVRAYSIVKHVGRSSGREYINPASAYPLGDGFVIPILYGLDSQWVRNVLGTGRLTLVTLGREHALERPELIPKTQALPAFPRWQRRTLKSRGIENFLWAHQHRTAATTTDG